MTQGLSKRDIAELLGISRPTVHGGRARGAHPGQVGRRVPHGDRGGREKAVALRPRPVPVPAPGGCSELEACRPAGGPARRSAGRQSGRLSRLS
ncbi:hypothetical protein ACFRJ3_45740 [Streptomyces sp. NPDC056696]|uniref:hypothetical protein n=1 Tax=unclassified Streptomyces TaxID=2593676 RepID=UPI0036D12664